MYSTNKGGRDWIFLFLMYFLINFPTGNEIVKLILHTESHFCYISCSVPLGWQSCGFVSELSLYFATLLRYSILTLHGTVEYRGKGICKSVLCCPSEGVRLAQIRHVPFQTKLKESTHFIKIMYFV